MTESCYMFVDQPLSWLDALNQCQAYKSTLVTVHSLTEQNYLAGIKRIAFYTFCLFKYKYKCTKDTNLYDLVFNCLVIYLFGYLSIWVFIYLGIYLFGYLSIWVFICLGTSLISVYLLP